MKRRDLLQHLTARDCQLLREGGRHSWWQHSVTGKRSAIPRHTAIKNLPRMLKEVPGIGCVLIGEGDLSQDLGFPRQYEHPVVAAAIDEILAICQEHNVVCGHPHANAKNIDELVAKGYRWLMTLPTLSFAGLEKGLKAAGRAPA